MPRIVATPHRMMPAHEVDLMAGIARADVDGFSIRGQHIAGTGELAASRAAGGGGVGATGIACGTGAGGAGEAPPGASPRWYERTSASRQTLALRTPAGPINPPSVSPRLAAVAIARSAKTDDEMLQ